jgi:hypothetical protein
MATRRRIVDSRELLAPLWLIKLDLLYRVLAHVLEANAAFIENLNRAQLAAGLNGDGSPINPPYVPATVAKKREKGQPTDRVTLHDEGSFYASIFTEVFTSAFDLNSDDPKAPELKAKYGDGILSLTEESKEKLIAHILPQFVAVLKREIGL